MRRHGFPASRASQELLQRDTQKCRVVHARFDAPQEAWEWLEALICELPGFEMQPRCRVVEDRIDPEAVSTQGC
jgi:hypothetical protein